MLILMVHMAVHGIIKSMRDFGEVKYSVIDLCQKGFTNGETTLDSTWLCFTDISPV